MKSGYFNYNKGKIYWEIVGKGEPIVFLHGFSLDHTIWKPQVDVFKHTHTVLSYDMRGFGLSPPPRETYSHHDDLYTLLQHLSLTKAHIIGLSLGGEVAIDFTITHPENVQSLTLINSSLGGYKSTVDWNVQAKEGGIIKAKTNWINHNVFASAVSNPQAQKILQHCVGSYSGWHWLHQDPRQKLLPSARTQLAQIKAPTAILVGQSDLTYYHDIAQILCKNIQNVTMHHILNAGHLANIENREDVNAQIEAQISRNKFW